jgi:transposase
MKKTSKHYTAEEKTKIAIEVLKGEFTIAELCSKYGVHANQLGSLK